MMSETVPASSTSEAFLDTLTGIYADIGRPDVAYPRSGLPGRADECRALDQLLAGGLGRQWAGWLAAVQRERGAQVALVATPATAKPKALEL